VQRGCQSKESNHRIINRIIIESIKSLSSCGVPINMSKKIIYGRARKFQNGKWSKWKDLKANDVKPDEGAKIGHSVCTLNMGFGRATIKYYPRMLTEKRREEVADSCRKCRKYRQYKMGLQCEPRVHVLFSDNVELGYRYHTVSMKPFPLSSQPVIESLASDLASYHELPNNSWNIGCNAVVYSDGRQSIGWHADDTQGEDIVHTYVAEAPADTHRSVLFRTKRCRKGKGMSSKEGDEEYSFNIRSGDACKFSVC
jgi:alkylated DNA repair dioxygenase AlkB